MEKKHYRGEALAIKNGAGLSIPNSQSAVRISLSFEAMPDEALKTFLSELRSAGYHLADNAEPDIKERLVRL